MANISGGPRSGENTVRNRKISRATNPNDEPEMSPPVHAENPNWFASAIRMIVTSARNLLPWDFESESPDDEDANNEDHDATATQWADRLLKKKGRSSEKIQVLRKPRTVVKESTFYGILENLLVQLTFSREVCDSLTKVISSRVVESPAWEENQDEQLSRIPNSTFASDAPTADICTAAVMEANKWMEEKKTGSGSFSELDRGTCSLNMATLSHKKDNLLLDHGELEEMRRVHAKTTDAKLKPVRGFKITEEDYDKLF